MAPGPLALDGAAPYPERQALAAQRRAQLAPLASPQNALEAFLTRPRRPPPRIWAIDNSIFVDGRPQSEIDLGRLRLGQRPDWMAEIEALNPAHPSHQNGPAADPGGE
ncbi:MAG: hypothetical protein AAGH87_10035 [Pseudomonadota bacterium]